MTEEQATDVRMHLINELNINGFHQIVTEVNTRLEENYEEKGFEKTPNYLLTYFLAESIDVLKNLSNKNFEQLLNKFNEFNSGENRIESITVELLDDGKPIYYNLNNLPDYSEIIYTFQTILNEIRNEI